MSWFASLDVSPATSKATTLPATTCTPTTSHSDDIDTDGEQHMTDRPEEVDPGVVEHVVAIRDRFGLRGLRGADVLIKQEIELAEEALQGLPTD
jgi:hypothetical protein